VKHAPLNDRFLETLINNRASWENEKEFSKVVKKMEQGKNLKLNEFNKFRWILWEIEHHR